MEYTGGPGSAVNQLQIGLVLPVAEQRMGGATPRWSDIATMARMAEEIGVHSLWLPDHLLFQADQAVTGQWEIMSMLGALAAVTRRAALGTLVLCTGFRNPALLAKMADTLDEISDGRLILGLGAGWNEFEHRAFGFPFDARASRFEEALAIIRGLLRDGRVDFAGRFYQARECELRPRGPRPTGPPILIGTRGERMLRLTARHADLWNVWLAFGTNQPAEIPPLRDAVDAACRAVGRDPASLARTAAVMVDPLGHAAGPIILARGGIAPTPIAGTPDEIAQRLLAFVGEGISHLQVHLHPNAPAGVAAFAPVLAALRAAGALHGHL
ncbi:MAG: LLM class flavin-dependent oxidoreductase [Chloroflexi bacterium]|nr:LLM class flavin-dependent oxidoreductase [Chloroflexota bacterium]